MRIELLIFRCSEHKKEGLGSYLTELVNAGCLRKDHLNGSYSFFMKLFKRYAAERLRAEVG
jgi:hypothetical protein